MKRKLMRLLACILIIGFALPTVGEIVAFADNEESSSEESAAYSAPAPEAPAAPTTTETTVITGEGTPESPKLTEKTVTEVDAETGDTTVTVNGEKKWESTDKSVTGSEIGIESEKRDTDDNLIESEGTVDGNETVVKETHSEDNSGDDVTIVNGTGTTEDGKTVKSDVPDVTLDLTPGKNDSKSKDAETWFDDSTLDLPSWVRSESDGKTTWAEASHSETNGVTDDISVSTETDEATGTKTDTYTRTVAGEDGKTIRETVVCKRNSRGYITDYSVETYEIESTTTESTTLPENAGAPSGEGSKTYGFELPEKPTVPEPSYAPDGSVENGQIVAELCDASGNVVGYTVVKVENGTVVSYGEPILGRYCVTETTIETLGNGLKKLTTTKTYTTSVKHSAQSGSVGSGKRTVNGWMGSVEESKETANGTLEGTFVPGKENLKNDETDFINDLFNRKKDNIVGYNENSQRIQYLGEISLESAIRVEAYEKDKDGNYNDITTGQAHIFVLQDGSGENGQPVNKYYVYCCDYDTSANHGVSYNVQRLEDATYYSHADSTGKAKNQIRSIVLNGYWGVANTSTDSASPTPGSLEAFKKMLVDAKIIEATDTLTDGMALTATQAAIWYYGSSDHKESLSTTDIVGVYCNGYEANGDMKESEVSAEKTEIVNKIYQYLINVDDKGLPGRKATADNNLLNAADFAKEIELTVGNGDGNGNYNTTIAFSMAEISEATKNDLVVYVMNGDDIICGYRLCGDDTNDSENNIKRAGKRENGSFILDTVLLPGGTNVDLKLNLFGKQVIENGALLFSCTDGYEKGQTFIGGGKYTKDINYSVKFGFNVTDPAVALKALAQATSSEKHDWSSEFYTFDSDGGGGGGRSGGDGGSDGGGGGGGRNFDVPKTGDGMLAVQAVLALGAALSLAGTALFLARAKRAA